MNSLANNWRPTAVSLFCFGGAAAFIVGGLALWLTQGPSSEEDIFPEFFALPAIGASYFAANGFIAWLLRSNSFRASATRAEIDAAFSPALAPRVARLSAACEVIVAICMVASIALCVTLIASKAATSHTGVFILSIGMACALPWAMVRDFVRCLATSQLPK
ncbi:MAG: hypothetical protein SF069_08945 [Phycisphaerae bacterium]|nr:hypothetical protein [Phycisphaerae bacterium]